MTDSHHIPTVQPPSIVGSILARIVVPAFVLFGAAMKFTSATPASLPHWIQRIVDGSAADEQAAEQIFLWVLRGVIGIEIVAVGLMFFVPRLSRIVAGLILTVFTFVLIAETAHLMKTGATFAAAITGSCGCFGQAVTIPLWVEFIINALLLSGVVLFKTNSTPLKATPKWAVAGLLLWLIAAGQVSMRANFPDEEDRDWQRMQPSYWVGRHYEETALFDFVNGADFSMYDIGLPQTWILYRRGCPVCHNLFEEHYSGEFPDRVVVAVEVPVDPGLATDGLAEGNVICPNCQFTSLVDGISWLVNTPTIIEFDKNGIVTEVHDTRLEEYGKSHDDI